MQFIKNHYEKVLLSIVLLGLAVAAAALPLKVSKEKQTLQETVGGFIRAKPKEFPVIDLSTNLAVLKRMETKVDVQLAGKHNLLNPVPWKKTKEGLWLKISDESVIGLGALVITRIIPLRTIVAVEGIAGSAENVRYQISVQQEAEARSRKILRQSQIGVKNDTFTLLAVRPQGEPTEFDILLKDEKEPITVARDKPFVRVDAYAADLRYPPRNSAFPNVRVKDKLKLPDDPETYNIVAIDEDEVVLSANSTGKRKTLKASSAAKDQAGS